MLCTARQLPWSWKKAARTPIACITFTLVRYLRMYVHTNTYTKCRLNAKIEKLRKHHHCYYDYQHLRSQMTSKHDVAYCFSRLDVVLNIAWVQSSTTLCFTLSLNDICTFRFLRNSQWNLWSPWAIGEMLLLLTVCACRSLHTLHWRKPVCMHQSQWPLFIAASQVMNTLTSIHN